MAEKSNEEYPYDSTDNTDNTSEIATSSNSKVNENGDDTSSVVCTIYIKKMPEVFSSDEPSSELDAASTSHNLSINTVVGTFLNELNEILSDDKYNSLHNDNVNVNVVDNDQDKLDENAQNNLVENDVDNGTNPVYSSADNNQHKILVTFKINLPIMDTLVTNSKIYIRSKQMPDIFFSIYKVKYNYPQLPLSISLTPKLNLDVNFFKHDREYVDFISVFTEFDFCLPFLEKVFSHLSFRDIASMTAVSKTWREAISKSKTAQKELENVFIHAILYFCHKNANANDEYQQLYENILIDFKKHIQFKKQKF